MITSTPQNIKAGSLTWNRASAQVIVEQGQVLDGALLLPALSHTIDTQPGDTGVFLFQCDVQVKESRGRPSSV